MKPEQEICQTVADARRLARKAKRVFIHFLVGPEEWKTNCIMLERAAFLRATRYQDVDTRMPCKLYGTEASDELWLQIGGTQ